jgi:hypothetical protein
MMMMKKGPIKRPKKVAKDAGKKARQRLMGMALGLHVLNKVITNAYFTLKTHMEAQVLLLLMTPFLLPLLVVLAIPLLAISVFGMVAAGLSANVDRFTKVQHVMDRRKFELVKRQSTRMMLLRSDTMETQNSSKRFARFASLTGGDAGSVKSKTLPPRSPSVVTRASLAPRPRAGGPPRRSQTFTFGTRV